MKNDWVLFFYCEMFVVFVDVGFRVSSLNFNLGGFFFIVYG